MPGCIFAARFALRSAAAATELGNTLGVGRVAHKGRRERQESAGPRLKEAADAREGTYAGLTILYRSNMEIVRVG